MPATLLAALAVLYVGDSLGVGTCDPLPSMLPRATVDVDVENGRASSEGVTILRERLRDSHDIVIFDLGTNDSELVRERIGKLT